MKTNTTKRKRNTGRSRTYGRIRKNSKTATRKRIDSD